MDQPFNDTYNGFKWGGRKSDNIRKQKKGWDKQWQKKVIQMQIPPLAETTVADWLLRFDDVLADALELGSLRTDCPKIPPALLARLETELPSGVSLEKVKVLVAYYLANRQPDSDWVVLPVTNFDAYFGGETFSKKELSKIPQTIIERKTGYWVCIQPTADYYLTTIFPKPKNTEKSAWQKQSSPLPSGFCVCAVPTETA